MNYCYQLAMVHGVVNSFGDGGKCPFEFMLQSQQNLNPMNNGTNNFQYSILGEFPLRRHIPDTIFTHGHKFN